MKSFLAALARIPDLALLAVNAALAGFVLLAHGGALLLVISGRAPAPPAYAEMVRRLTPITLPLAGAVLVMSAVGAVWPTQRGTVQRLQAVAVFGSGIAGLWWALGIMMSGFPKGVGFAWTPGMLTGWVGYGFLVMARAIWPERLHGSRLYAPLVGAALALPVDIGVFAKLIMAVGHHL